MLRSIRNFFTPPIVPDDEEKTRVAGLLVRILTATYILLPTALLMLVFNPEVGRVYTPFTLGIAIVATILLGTAKRGYIRPASMALITTFLIFSTLSDLFANGGPRPITLSSAAVVVIGGLLLGTRGALVTAILFSLKHVIVLALVHVGQFASPVYNPLPSPFADGLTTTIGYFMVAIIFSLAANSLYAAVKRARQSEFELSTSNRQLQELTQHLESRIRERTSDLELATVLSEKRARQFEAITRVARATASTQDLQELLPRICEAINEQFGYYHAGIFLNEKEDQFTILRAANSIGGRKMLARGHQLKIGEQGIVGYVTGTGNPRIASNVGEDSVYFNNPDLPETHSEMALPLKVASKTIGALDVQSMESGAFKTEDIAALSILADQVSIAIENARLYESALSSLEQSQTQYSRYLKGEWSRLTQEENLVGYRFTAGSSEPLEESIPLGEAEQMVQEGKIFQREGTQASDTAELSIPVRLRGEVIGALSISMPGKRQWSDDDIDIAEAVSERLALAMENARLFQVTNKRAERERIVSDIASKISGNIRIESLLETTAQELSQALNGSEVLIQLQAANQPGGPA